MTCVPGKIRTRLSAAAYENAREGLTTARERLRSRVDCDICGVSLQANTLQSHLEKVHDVYRSRVIDQDLLVERDSITYSAPASVSGVYYCPVPDCKGSARTKWTLRRHFRDRHPLDLVSIPGEGTYPRCELCGMQTAPSTTGHEQSLFCREGQAQKVQHAAAVDSAHALEQTFTAYGEVLERVEVFKYLGRLLAFDDTDIQAVRKNLRKARKCWARISRVLRAENASPRVCGMFYKATVQAVLLFGSETWNLSPLAMKSLEGFHMRAAWWMVHDNKPCREPDGMWKYPSSEDVLKEVGCSALPTMWRDGGRQSPVLLLLSPFLTTVWKGSGYVGPALASSGGNSQWI